MIDDKTKQNIMAGAEIHSDKGSSGYSEGSFDHPGYKEIQAKWHALYTPCACMGPQGDDPHCPCTMRSMGLEPSNQWTEEDKQALNTAMGQFYDANR